MILLLLAPLIAVLVIVAAALVLRGQRAHQARLVGRVVEHVHDVEPRPLPAILYFTGAACTICHTAQRPALRQLARRTGGAIPIREVDIAAEPELAKRYRVMSLPTTIVLSPSGEITAVNVGFAGVEQLQEQLARAAQQVAA